MNIIISPAKKMETEEDILCPSSSPVFLEQAKQIRDTLAGYSMEELKSLYNANDGITELNYRRIQEMDLDRGTTPAVLAYIGIQYQSMAPRVFTDSQWDYVREHLWILSGFYGALRAMDGIVPYRLEMQAKLKVGTAKDLYDLWGDRIYKELKKKSPVTVNLASKEYSRAVEPYLTEEDRFITCVFGSLSEGKKGLQVKVTATRAKAARGMMVRWMAKEQIEDPEDLKEFHEGGYRYAPEYSQKDKLVFL